MVTDLKELISVDFWQGVIFEAMMVTIINMQLFYQPRGLPGWECIKIALTS